MRTMSEGRSWLDVWSWVLLISLTHSSIIEMCVSYQRHPGYWTVWSRRSPSQPQWTVTTLAPLEWKQLAAGKISGPSSGSAGKRHNRAFVPLILHMAHVLPRGLTCVSWRRPQMVEEPPAGWEQTSQKKRKKHCDDQQWGSKEADGGVGAAQVSLGVKGRQSEANPDRT